MALKANESKNTGGGGDFAPIEPGTYPARLVMVADLGLQSQKPFNGQEKAPAYEILVTYEFVDEFLLDEDGNEQKDKPRWMSEKFPLYSLKSERAKSTIRYLALDPQKVHDGDWSALLDTPCLVTVVHNPKKDGEGVWVNIASVAAMRAKDAVNAPDLVNEARVFDLDAPDVEEYNKLPQWVQDKIKANLEFPGSKLEKLLAKNNQGAKAKKAEEAAGPEFDDEIPF